MKIKDYEKDSSYTSIMTSFHGRSFHRLYTKTIDTNSEPGYLYLIQLGDTDIFKIGITRDLKKRLSQLQRKSLIDLQIIHSWHSHDYQLCEWLLHDKYSSKRVKDEWFKLTPNDLKEIHIWFPDDQRFPGIEWNHN